MELSVACFAFYCLHFFVTSALLDNNTEYSVAQSQTRCEPLPNSQNVDIICRETRENATICKYKCKSHHVATENSGKTVHAVKCGIDGKWIGLNKFKAFECQEDCGKRLSNPKPLIINGVNTNSFSWPWHAAIFRKNDINQFQYVCGGSLIRNSVVVTAAHCVAELGEVTPLQADQFKVVLGAATPQLNGTGDHSQVFMIKRLYISKNYDPRKEHQADIALIHLNGRVVLNDYVLPICLPNDYALDLNAVKPGKVGEVVGFGIWKSRRISPTLRHGSLLVITHSECFHSLRRVLSESQFCAGNRQDKRWTTVCNGDSGGGFVSASAVVQKYFIHGIVSTGDPNLEDGLCQNYAVFTRVFQFIFWIRDVLEKISGENIRELASNSKYPYIQRGSESIHSLLSPIPREWDNLVTSVELLYTEIDPDIFLQSLQYNGGISFMNLSHVKFTKKIQERVVLPHLHTFILDKAGLDCSGIHEEGVEECEDVPREYSKEDIKALIFFDKEYEQSLKLEGIVGLNTNVELTAHTFKLISLHHEEGRLGLQIPFAAEILQNLPPPAEFSLRHLILANCELDLNSVQAEHFKNVRTLMMSNVTITGAQFGRFLKNLHFLQEFRFLANDAEEEEEVEVRGQNEASGECTGNVNCTIVYVEDLPQSVRHLAIAQTSLHYAPPPPPGTPTQIFFPDSPELAAYLQRRKLRLDLILPNVETFYCNRCEMDTQIILNFPAMFPSLKRLFLIGEHRLNLTQLMMKLEQCKFVFIDNAGNSNFTDFQYFPPFPLRSDSSESHSRTSFYILEKKYEQWTYRSISAKERLAMEFAVLGLSNLWTSLADFEVRDRLSSWEKAALESGHYVFNGGNATKVKQFPPLQKIPENLQARLQTIHISNAAVSPALLIWSLKSTEELTSLVLDRVNLLGPFEDSSELLSLKEYTLRRVIVFKSFDYILTEPNLESLLPFGVTEVKNSENIQAPFNFLQPQNQTAMEKLEIMYDDCIKIFIDYVRRVLISSMSYVQERETLTTLHKHNYKSISVRLLLSELLSLSVPRDVEELNLYRIEHQVYGHEQLTSAEKISSLLRSLTAVKKLRLVFSVDANGGNRTVVNLSDLKHLSNYITTLALAGAHVSYSPGVSFKNLKTLFLEACTFDKEVVNNFMEIFQTEAFGIVSYAYIESSFKLRTNDNEKILLDILKSGSRVNWVLGYLGKTMPRGDYTTGILDILESAGVPTEQRPSFILERENAMNPKWAAVRIKQDGHQEVIASETARLRGDNIFGKGYCNHDNPFPDNVY